MGVKSTIELSRSEAEIQLLEHLATIVVEDLSNEELTFLLEMFEDLLSEKHKFTGSFNFRISGEN